MCIDMFSHLHDLLSFCTELSFRRLHAPSKWLGFKCEGPCSGLEPQNGKKVHSCDKHSVVLLQGAEIVEHPDRMKRKELKESLLKQRPTSQSIDGCSILPRSQIGSSPISANTNARLNIPSGCSMWRWSLLHSLTIRSPRQSHSSASSASIISCKCLREARCASSHRSADQRKDFFASHNLDKYIYIYI